MDHLDIVQRIYGERPAEKTVEGAFTFLQRVLAELPAEEKAGLVQSFAGAANTVLYPNAPGGRYVRVSRVIYPDGTMFKILTDVPATNGPAWNPDDFRPDLYVAYVPPSEPEVPVVVPPPVDEPSVLDTEWIDDFDLLHNKLEHIITQNDALLARLNEIVDNFYKSAKPYEEALKTNGIGGLLKLFS